MTAGRKFLLSPFTNRVGLPLSFKMRKNRDPLESADMMYKGGFIFGVSTLLEIDQTPQDVRKELRERKYVKSSG